MTAGSSLAEVPLAYPCQAARQRRYVVNDSNGTVHRETNDTQNVPLYDASIEMERFRGSASVSCLRFGTKEAVVTTSALPSEPKVLSLAVSWNGYVEGGAASSVELDLGWEMTRFTRPVKVQCFALEGYTGDDEALSIVMVDLKGVVLSLRLEAQTLTPLMSSLRISSVPEILKERAESGEEMYTDTDLHSHMIVFLSATIVLVALSPLLLTVDIESNHIALWSEIQCQEEMRSRREVFGNILATAGNMLLGHMDENFIDMPPTAALCLASNASNDATSHDVFTMHSDASLRRWRIDPSASLRPFEVSMLQIPGQGAVVCEPLIPPPSLWSHSFNSVAISARLYESIYALAVHIQTIDSSLSADSGCCQLIVLHGSRDIRSSVESTLHLSVPGGASFLVGMGFLPNMNRCSLRALFQTEPQTRENFSETLTATYPPSITSIVGVQPILSSSQDTLEGVAKAERDRICSLSFEASNVNASLDDDLHELDSRYMKYFFRPSFPRGSGTVLAPTDSSIRKALRKLVPRHARAADGHMSIQLETLRAIHTWRKIENRGAALASSSTQRELIVAEGTSDSMSVYQSFVASTPSRDTIPENMDVDDEYDTDGEEYERSLQLAAHERRWKRFLLAVWDEEHILRTPLCMKLLSSAHGQGVCLVRVGITSVLSDVQSIPEATRATEWGTLDMLDKIALKLISRIHKDSDRSTRLCALEMTLWEIVSKVQFLLPSSSSEESMRHVLNELCVLGTWSLDDEVQSSGGTPKGITRAALEESLGTVSSSDLMSWLEEAPLTSSETSHALPGLSLLSCGRDALGEGRNDAYKKHIPTSNTRHSACSISVRCVDSVRHLQLGRCLLLFGVGQEGGMGTNSPLKNPTHQAAFRSYLHSLSILWTSSQLATMPSSSHIRPLAAVPLGSFPNTDGPSPSKSPPLKRPSFGNEAPVGLLSTTSHPGISNMTTALDVALIYLSQFINESKFPTDVATALVRGFFQSSFGRNKSDPSEPVATKPSILLPELGVLPPPLNDAVPSDYPRLALRLLAPFNAFPPATDSVHVARARSEASAGCLLIEANALSRTGAVNETRKRQMIHKACEMLMPSSAGSDETRGNNLDEIDKAVILLRSAIPDDLQWGREREDALVRVLQNILGDPDQQTPSTVATVDLRRLGQLHVTRTLFSPLVSSHPPDFRETLEAIGMDESATVGTELLAAALLRVSHLTHRLSLLEQHLGNVGRLGSQMSSSGSVLLLEYIEDSISEINELLPPRVYRSMSEYTTLWSMLFRHAVAGRHWKKAYDACVNNPVLERKVKNYERLVLAMVEAGSLGELLDLCSVVSGRGSVEMAIVDSVDSASNSGVEGRADECIDLYEIAAETLAEASNRAIVSLPVGATNFGGCLYALHASHRHWRRAAQAMDMRYNVAKSFLAKLQEAEVGMIIEELSLTALGALHSLLMVKDSSERFYVAGEVGPYPILPFFGSSIERDPFPGQNGKRGRGKELIDPPRAVSEKSEASDRLSNYLTPTSLKRRVVQAMSFRILLLDGSVPIEGSSSSRETDAVQAMDIRRMFLDGSPSADFDRGIIDLLSARGFYQHALLLAETMRDSFQELTGGQPDGRDQMQDSVSYVLRSNLVPVVVRATRPQPNATEQEDRARPTFSQLCKAFDGVTLSCTSITQFTREDWRTTEWIANSSKGTVAMALIQKLVMLQSSPDSPVALETAGYFLDFDSGRAQVPDWLEHLLMGVHANADGDTRGLFACMAKNVPSTPKSCYGGDPPGLLRLYMKHGMYVEACNVISAVLSGDGIGGSDNTRETSAPSRLPEKGDIDFVPYRVIDVLWDLLAKAIGSPSTHGAARNRMVEARTSMEKSLQRHFELMKISEMGIQSARALSQ